MNKQVCSKCGSSIIIRYVNGKKVPIHLNWSCNNVDIESKRKQLKRILKSDDFNSSKSAPKSFTVPNSKCPVCRVQVFYYENENGSKVYFDDLGPPWPKHPCTDKGRQITNPSRGLINQTAGKWYRFYVKRIQFERVKGGYEVEWFGYTNKSPDKLIYRFSLLEINPDEILKDTCFLKEIENRRHLITFFLKNDFNTLNEAKLYPPREFENIKSNVSNINRGEKDDYIIYEEIETDGLREKKHKEA